MKLVILTIFSMLAFAANSVLCRLALANTENNPLSFTIVRLFSGALLLSIVLLKRKSSTIMPQSLIEWMPAAALFMYALFFSLSYVQISAGTGALILFASVQMTMMITHLVRGAKISKQEGFGFMLAFAGLVYLVAPSLRTPSFGAALMMMISGISWGVYTLLGKNVTQPTLATAKNFVFTMPMVALLFLFVGRLQLSEQGLWLAIISGGITSALGYVVWYGAVAKLTTSTAAIVQLSVPLLAAIAGVIFLSESFTYRLAISSLLIFMGIIVKTVSRKTISS